MLIFPNMKKLLPRQKKIDSNDEVIAETHFKKCITERWLNLEKNQV